ncbi:MAG: hypothetical protein FJ302_18685 [Planctomycetes bacterium]|nr:hypothetical protein [Planctomycetota bacterium]
MKRLTTMLALAAMMSSLTGCCCWWPWNGYGYGSSCGTSPCGPAGCAPGFSSPYTTPGTTYTPGATTYQTYDSVTGLPLSTTTAYQPVVVAPAVSLGPLEALPTYR